ncbi:MAG: hypothetical protein ACFCVH_17915 [Alphaproteobacteria bacterium]
MPIELVEASDLHHAMLFELAYARGEQMLEGTAIADWSACLTASVQRQKRYFDARTPEFLSEADTLVAEWVGKNMAQMLWEIETKASEGRLIRSPSIPGYQWIANGEGDFSVGSNIIEIKCTNRNFGSADYRQILMYWLLSYAAAIESDSSEWQVGILLNPRLNHFVRISFDEIVSVTAAGNSKVEVLELFSSVVGDEALALLSEFRL